MYSLLQYFLAKDDDANQIKVLRKCIMHALSVRDLNPDLTELSMSHLLDVILGQNVDDWLSQYICADFILSFLKF